MGILAPLFLAGLAALSIPLVLHLVRRTPKGRQQFSSLMFLQPTPPRLTRRSRMDQFFLLLLRLAALALLIFAFTRPFVRESALLALSDLPGRKVAILVDTSASMQRGDLWNQVLNEVERELADLAPQDEVALYTFTNRLQQVVRFADQQPEGNTTQINVILQQLKTLKPTWEASDLGAPLVALAAELDATSDVERSAVGPKIVLISDLQRGARTEALQAYEWPEQVTLVPKVLATQETTNALAHLLPAEDDAPEAEQRVRVVNAADSTDDQFYLRWNSGDSSSSTVAETAVYVPPGQSRVVRLPRTDANLAADRILLRGDDHTFDNVHFVVPPRKTEFTLAYIGSDAADDPQGMQYYLRLAVDGDPLRLAKIEQLATDDQRELLSGPLPPPLIVATRVISPALQTTLKDYVDRGGVLLFVPADADAAAALPTFFDDLTLPDTAEETSDSAYLLLGEIDFAHPLFAPLASPRYNDFTKINFWQHRRVEVQPAGETQVVARFDNGDPFLLDRAIGQGRVFALTSGWNPDDSQLGVSSKFVPIMSSLIDQAVGTGATLSQIAVGQPVPLERKSASAVIVRGPDGAETKLADDASEFTSTDLPGIYTVNIDGDELRFAVNLASAESDTTGMEVTQLEQLGVQLGDGLSRADQLAQIRQQRDVELESRQKIWRWLLVGCLGLLVFETWWAGRAARQTEKPVEAFV